MCHFKSFLVLKPEQEGARPRILHKHGVDSHSDLMAQLNVRERSSASAKDQPLARVECTPDWSKDPTLDESWTFRLDEERTPDWWADSAEWAEKECKRICRSLVVTSGERDGEDVIVSANGSVTIKNGRAWAWGSSKVVAWGSSKVEAWGSSKVEAWGSSKVEAWDSSKVEAWGSSKVEAWGSSKVEAWDSSKVVAWGSSKVEAWGSSKVEAWGSSKVEAWDSSKVEAWGSSKVVAWGSSKVEAWGSSKVEAWGSSKVEAWDSSKVEAWGSSKVEAWGSSKVDPKSKYAICARRGDWDGAGYPWAIIPFVEPVAP
jgi:hypothetical protein